MAKVAAQDCEKGGGSSLERSESEEAESLVTNATRSLEDLHLATRKFTSEAMQWRAGLLKARNVCLELGYIEEILSQVFSDKPFETDKRNILSTLLAYHERPSLL